MTLLLLQTGLLETGLTGAIGAGIVFVEAGLAKLRHRELVPGVVANYRLLPESLVQPVATLLPVVELGVGLGLIASVLTASGLNAGDLNVGDLNVGVLNVGVLNVGVLNVGVLNFGVTGGGGLRLFALPAAALLVVFAWAMAINIRRGRRAIDCGCGRSQLRQPLGWGLVVRNVVLALLVAIRALPGESASAVEIALALIAGITLFAIILLFNALAALAASPLKSR